MVKQNLVICDIQPKIEQKMKEIKKLCNLKSIFEIQEIELKERISEINDLIDDLEILSTNVYEQAKKMESRLSDYREAIEKLGFKRIK